MELSSQQNEQQKELSQYMIDVVGLDSSPTVFGWLLYRMSDFDRAERYAQYIIQQRLDETEKAAAYNLLGLIYSDRKNYKKSIEYYQQAIEIHGDCVRFVGPQIIAIHYNLSLAHLVDGDNRLAEDQRRIVDKLLAEYHANLGRLRYERKEYELALEQFERSLKITTDATHEDRNIITELLRCIKEINNIIDPLPSE